MTDAIIIAVVAAIVGLAGWYVHRSVKAGKPCIGCPENGNCAARGCSGNCSGCGGSCPSRKA